MLTKRDLELLSTLANAVRAFTLRQLACAWWPSRTAESARARLRVLERAGYVRLETQPVGPILALEEPLLTWQPGLPRPELGPVAQTARRRWRKPVETLLCVSVTDLGATHVGTGSARAPRPTEWTHDLHLAEVYLRLRQIVPIRARSWRHEDMESHRAVDRAGEKLPDALVRDGLQTTAIELVGSSYSREKLNAFHDHCHEHDLGYELW